MSVFPAEPPVPESQRASSPVTLRYEDVTQDGRISLAGLPHALGQVVWQQLFADHPLTHALRESGTIPLLTRMVLEGGDEPISIRRPLEGRGLYQLAHARGADGEVAKLFLNLWTSLSGARGRTHGPAPVGAGAPVFVGRVFAEHVFTRPFAPPGARKVVALAGAGFESVPPDRWAWRPAEDLLALPPGATPLDPGGAEPALDPVPVVFGLDHTDSNQHVNSLVYPRFFGDAALRRLAELGHSTSGLLARALEIAWRKPCFAGDRVRLRLRAFSVPGALGAAGAFVADDSPAPATARPYCTLRVLFPLAAPPR